MLLENLKYLREKEGFTQAEMLEFIGIKGNTKWSDYERGKSTPPLDILLKLSDIFRISMDDLVRSNLSIGKIFENQKENLETQKGKKIGKILGKNIGDFTQNAPLKVGAEMPKTVVVTSQNEELVPLVPVKARAGYLIGYGDIEYMGKLPVYSFPNLRPATYRVFEVEGNSMFSCLADKDRVLARWANATEINNDRVYVLVTANEGILIKRCLNKVSEGVIICKSDNNHKGEYPNIVLEVNQILECWYVQERLTKQLPNPNDFYRRIQDMEADITLLKQKLNNAPKINPH